MSTWRHRSLASAGRTHDLGLCIAWSEVAEDAVLTECWVAILSSDGTVRLLSSEYRGGLGVHGGSGGEGRDRVRQHDDGRYSQQDQRGYDRRGLDGDLGGEEEPSQP